ncbi:hypothetical protein F5Y06DRAFT_298125 [Hypoxylon sp. FL0890]|nr:hypothetical protein F5Y06DRAFT_298125 [Hypoxylon sp. FL0890]
MLSQALQIQASGISSFSDQNLTDTKKAIVDLLLAHNAGTLDEESYASYNNFRVMKPGRYPSLDKTTRIHGGMYTCTRSEGSLPFQSVLVEAGPDSTVVQIVIVSKGQWLDSESSNPGGHVLELLALNFVVQVPDYLRQSSGKLIPYSKYDQYDQDIVEFVALNDTPRRSVWENHRAMNEPLYIDRSRTSDAILGYNEGGRHCCCGELCRPEVLGYSRNCVLLSAAVLLEGHEAWGLHTPNPSQASAHALELALVLGQSDTG